LPDLVNGVDVGMVQGRRGAGLAAKAFECLRIFGNAIRQELQSDETSEFGVLGFVDNMSLPKTSSACRHPLLKKMIEAALK
jgi:hypothetical protein